MCKKELEIEEMLNHMCPATYRQTTFAGDSPIPEPTKPVDPANLIDNTLTERGKEYGVFVNQAEIAQFMKVYIRGYMKWFEMKPDQQEALDMILHKISRILNGNPDNVDSWHDIAGYATLIADRLRGNSR
jgi:hypothetical protein